MSYSNNWSVTGVTGISSLKECYKWNSSNRLYDFGMLRLKDDDVKVNTHTIDVLLNGKIPVSIDEIISTNNNYSSYFRYYAIPGYLITNKNMTAVGITDDSDEEDAYNHASMTYYTAEENSRAKNWKYIKYPTFISFLDSFSSFWIEQIHPEDARVNQNIFYDKDSRWVAMLQTVYNNNFTNYTADLNNYIVASYYHNVLGNVVGSGTGTDTYTLEHLHNDSGDEIIETDATVRLRYQSKTALVFKNGNNVEITDISLKSKLNKLFNVVNINLRSSSYSFDKGFGRYYDNIYYYFVWRMYCSIECLNTSCYLPYYYSNGIAPEPFDGNKTTLTTNFDTITGERETRHSNVWFNVYSNLRTNNQTIDIDPYFKGYHMHNKWNHLQVKDGTSYSIPWLDNGSNPKIWRDEFFQYYYFSYDEGDFYIQGSGQGHGSVYEQWPLWEELAYYDGYVHDDEPWITLHQSQYAQYTCPLILSSEPAICFERFEDTRITPHNGYAYKVYIGDKQARVNNFGARKIRVYLYKTHQSTRNWVDITLGQSTHFGIGMPNGESNGTLYWDSYEDPGSGALYGCLVFAGPNESYGKWQGFGPAVNLCPSFTGHYVVNEFDPDNYGYTVNAYKIYIPIASVDEATITFIHPVTNQLTSATISGIRNMVDGRTKSTNIGYYNSKTYYINIHRIGSYQIIYIDYEEPYEEYYVNAYYDDHGEGFGLQRVEWR